MDDRCYVKNDIAHVPMLTHKNISLTAENQLIVF